MSTEELGKALTHARTARGLTLNDVERDTRISSKYIKALEEGQLQTLPAPVYARAFMRTYAQYLGLNARDFVMQLPGARPEPDMPPLPDVSHGHLPLISPGWVVAGIIVALLVGVGMVLFWNRDEGSSTSARSQPTGQLVGQGAEQPTGEPGAIEPQPGQVPDLGGQNVLTAISALDQSGLEYFVIEVDSDEDQKQLVLNQSPSPGTPLSQGGVVTLVVGR